MTKRTHRRLVNAYLFATIILVLVTIALSSTILALFSMTLAVATFIRAIIIWRTYHPQED